MLDMACVILWILCMPKSGDACGASHRAGSVFECEMDFIFFRLLAVADWVTKRSCLFSV